MRARSLQEQFARVEKPEGECWVWKWARNGAGRASFRGLSAPREVYEMLNQCEVPEHLGVLHSCDNPMCVNPAHLRVGTQKDNMRECADKGRRSPNSKQPPGERHSMAKLSAEHVVAIRARAAAGHRRKDIAADYPVGPTQIRRIISGVRWSALA